MLIIIAKVGNNMDNTTSGRKYYLDNVRWITVILVVLYHAIYMYTPIITIGVGPISNQSVQYQDAYLYVVYPWFMAILFLVSGMSARFYLAKHTDKEFVKSRTTKLLVPSTIGLFVFQWIQGYVSMGISNAFAEMPDTLPKPVLYFIMVLSGTGVLWYIQTLWILSMGLVLLRKIEKDRLWTLGGKFSKFGIIGLLLLVLPVFLFAQILNMPVITVYRFGLYGLCFLLGYYIFSHDEVIEHLEKHAVWLAVAAIVLCVVYIIVYFGENFADAPVNRSILNTVFLWVACLAILGCMKRFYDKSDAFTSWMGKRSFGLYVFHYLPISAFALYVGKSSGMPVALIYLLTIAAGFAGGYLLNEIISRIPFVRWAVLGTKKKKADNKNQKEKADREA